MVTNHLADLSQSLCNLVPGDAEAAHAKHFDIHSHLGCSPKIAYAIVYSSSYPTTPAITRQAQGRGIGKPAASTISSANPAYFEIMLSDHVDHKYPFNLGIYKPEFKLCMLRKTMV